MKKIYPKEWIAWIDPKTERRALHGQEVDGRESTSIGEPNEWERGQESDSPSPSWHPSTGCDRLPV